MLDDDDEIGFIFDGTGYGVDATLWGGEVFVDGKRVYRFKPLKLLGGEKAIKECYRIAFAKLFESYTLKEVQTLKLDIVKRYAKEIPILYRMYEKSLNAPLSSSVGRLFDMVACFGGLCDVQSYEGEAGLLCQTNYDPSITESFHYTIKEGVIDIVFDFFDKNIVSKFINTLCDIIINIAKKHSKKVLLSGGVFQNKVLVEKLDTLFKTHNIIYYVGRRVPPNDSGISIGQLYEAIKENEWKK